MPKILQYAMLMVTHPNELRAVINWAVWRDPTQRIEEMEESGFKRDTMKRCWYFLDMTSRSFAAVIKELEGELCRVICLFYLVLRALDTVEDDMTLDTDVKCKILEEFHEKLSEPGWTFTGSGPDEKDRQLLVDFDNVITEVMSLDERYRRVITRICRHMGAGMAHYAREGATASKSASNASEASYAINTLADFDLYCHYVAGLVGEGLSALFSASGKEREDLGRMLKLSNSMGLMLQKTNIMRDFREDLEDGRFFWPREIWSKYSPDPKAFYQNEDDPEIQKKALFALSEMILDALAHATDCLDYLSLLKNQSVFSFAAVPQVMAIATLERCFMNPDVFKKNVKIRKSLAVQLLQRATNPREVSLIFTDYSRRILSKAIPSDPNYLKICVAVGQIEQWGENRYPSWIFMSNETGGLRKGLPQTRDDPIAAQIGDARTRQLPSSDELRSLQAQKRGLPPPTVDDGKMSKQDIQILLLFVGGLVVLILGVVGASFGLVWYFTTHENTLIERALTRWTASLEGGWDAADRFIKSIRSQFEKSEL